MTEEVGTIVFKEIKKEVSKFFQIPIDDKSIYQKLKACRNELVDKIINEPTSMLSYIDDYELILGFERYAKKRHLSITKSTVKNDRLLRSFINFASAFQRIYYIEDQNTRKKMIGSLKRGLNLSSRLFPFQHEIETYVHLSQLHFDLKCIDGKNGAPYDFNATIDNTTFAIECKTISRYAGSPIISTAANEFTKKIDWALIRKIIKSPSVIVFPFRGKLQNDKDVNNHSPESLLQDFNNKLTNKIDELKVISAIQPNTIDRRWLSEKFLELQTEYPLGYIVRPLTLPIGEPVVFIVLVSNEKSDYLNEFEERLDKALVQVRGPQPSVIYLYPENATSEDLKETKSLLHQIIQPKLDQTSQPLMCCVRSIFKDDLNSYANVSVYKNNTFEPFYPLFQVEEFL